MHLVVVAVLKHIDAVERVNIACDLCTYIPVDQVLLIDESPIALLRIHKII